ncbi:SGNH/GDSL hydrolase family protein [Ulvibacter litoralis]|uniref:GDSL-like Lipase/Acylhydrolase n=1 Tax=Ulvibacter litoralis TaxID=227084 RepID=A0A1G7J7E5_9FLAO|nr:SGNH/GDSL hydrolase family protein [Ulvibacter litoralis]GHC64229.1 outer membrane protein [Ulvibacter litoralis]SDF20840.1 GDSL-like Lipase/Acylhydrolase [Ulvibacter litoralis]
MKNTIKLMIGLATVGLVSCDAEFDNPVTEAGFYTSGTADFTRYVAVGNSLTAGYADGALYITGQENSYPNIMAQQFALAGGGEFTQPLMDDNLGGLLLNGTQVFNNRFVLSVDENGNPGPVLLEGTPTTDVATSAAGPFNNMGVPGAKSFHLAAPGYGSANPWFGRFQTSQSASIIADATSMNPTFFSLWIGNNDILSYATSGGIGVDQTGNLNPATYGPNDITDPNVFAATYSGLVDALTANGSKGAVVNIPDVTSIPFFTTVPYAPLSPLNPAFGPQIPALNATYAQLNAAFAFLGVPERSIVFSQTAASGVVVHDEGLEDLSTALTQVLIGGGLDPGTATIYGMQYGQARQANAGDLLVLTSSSAIATVDTDRVAELMSFGLTQAQAGQLSVVGVTYPMPDQYVLVPVEQEAISTAATAYNAAIEGIAASKGLAFVDAKSRLGQVANGGVGYDGGVLTSQFVTGGAFSLDGVHPSPRGYAFTANAIIDAINETYEATIPKVAIGNYGTVTATNN